MSGKPLKTVWCTYTFVSLGALVALRLIFTRMLAINIGGFVRISLGSVATIMAGLWLGPAGGALCGIAGDLLGCLMQGYFVNPFILLAAALTGVLPVITSYLLLRGRKTSRAKRIAAVCAGVLVSCIICTLFLTTLGLVTMYGYNLFAILPSRLIQFAFMTPVYCILVNLLYESPVTNMIRQALESKAGKAAHAG